MSIHHSVHCSDMQNVTVTDTWDGDITAGSTEEIKVMDRSAYRFLAN